MLSPAHRAASKRAYQRKAAIIAAAKNKPCMDCGGVFDPVCMDFDHRPDEHKVMAVAHMVYRSVTAIEFEIAKCDVVCANCHRLRTKVRRDTC